MSQLAVHMLSGSAEYRSAEQLPRLSAHLQTRGIHSTISFADDGGEGFPGLEQLAAADVLLVFSRRVTLPPEQLLRIQQWCREGRPVIGLRTASHGLQNWLAFDHEILGGDYTGHGAAEDDIRVEVCAEHPVVAGLSDWRRPGKLYYNRQLAADTTVLLRGYGRETTEPLAWLRTTPSGSRVFYTSLGCPHDFAAPPFMQLVTAAVYWCSGAPQSCQA